MKFIPGLDRQKELLGAIGLGSIDQLFEDIPPKARAKRLRIAPGRPEWEVRRDVEQILDKNVSARDWPCFLGGGMYDHYVPAITAPMILRGEFYTSYTPYQPEILQGMLQALFEYQSYLAELLEMDAVNSSMYDGATALGEAARMCVRITGRNRFVLPASIHPDRAAVTRTYLTGTGVAIDTVPFDRTTGRIDLAALRGAITERTAGVYLENPNLFGVWEEEVDEVAAAAHAKGALLVAGVNPMSLGVARGPGDYGADIAVGEGQPLGNPMGYGGPSFGIFGCRREHLRQLPGRVVGLTKDVHGARAFCLTLQTREQHIRREKATSNICTNQALMALASLVGAAMLGRTGLQSIGTYLAARAREFARRIAAIPGFAAPAFTGSHFNEFVYRAPGASAEAVLQRLLKRRVLGGTSVQPWFPDLGPLVLVAVTERLTDDDFGRYIAPLAASATGGSPDG